MDFSACLTHSQTCDNVHGPGATQWTASAQAIHMPKPVMTSALTCATMDCFGTYVTHVQSCVVTRVLSATEWTASVHTSHMSKAVM